MDPEIIAALIAIVGEENALVQGPELLDYGSDATKLVFRPDLVLFPQNAQEIKEILNLANRHLFPVIPRGGGTGMSGGALPNRGGVVLGFKRMNRIIEISPEDGLCVVEPGVKTYDLQEEVKKKGLYYPPDPASAKDCTIGGNIAECAGGLKAIKYGVTRDYVLGIQVVLPTGEVIDLGGKTLKGVVGYDLTRLVVGSEGTLGIITKAILRLIPQPEARATLFACFPDHAQAIESMFRILLGGVLPCACEFMDSLSYQCVKERVPFQVPYSKPAFTILELDGRRHQVMEDLSLALSIVSLKGRVLAVEHEDESEKIWNIRRELSPSMYKLRPNKASEDVVVPRSKITLLMDTIEQISNETKIPIPVFGHLGDGNLHINIMYDQTVQEEAEMVPKIIMQIFQRVIELGGTISGEHGIGITKAPYLQMELGNEQIKAMKAIKRALDPNNIMNPYKIFA